MSFLLDTNVVSEWMKPQPNAGVVTWLAEVDEDRTYLSVITLTELRYRIERLPLGARRKKLGEWLADEVPIRFEGRILRIDAAVAHECGRILSQTETLGRKMEVMDGFIAATAVVHDLVVVTRNVSHFEQAAQSVVNPWA